MSDLQSSAISGASGSLPVVNTATRLEQSGNTSVGSQSAESLQAVQSAGSSRSEVVGFASSSYSMQFEQSSQNERMAMLVMMLIQLLFGQNEDDQRESDPFMAMAGLMMLSSFSQSYQQVSYFESQSSQVSLSMTTENASAVQVTSYVQSSGDSVSGETPVGRNLDITG